MKIAVFDHFLITNHANIRRNLILLETTELLGYIVAADSMGLSSLTRSGWDPKDSCTLKQIA